MQTRRRLVRVALAAMTGLLLIAGAGVPASASAPAPGPTPIPVPPQTQAPEAPATPDVPPPSSAPESSGCGLVEVACQVEEGVSDAVRVGFLGVVDLAVAAFGWALSRVAEQVFSDISVEVDDAFYGVYNDVASIVGLFVLLMFAFSVGINALRVQQDGGPVRIVLGFLRAILGIAFAGGIAFTLVRLWDEATLALIDRNADRDWDPSSWLRGLHELGGDAGTALIALIIAVFSLFGLLIIAIILIFRGVLVIGAGLVGVAAMAGQAMDATRPWGRRWFWTINALAASKFWIVAFWIYGTRAPYESDALLNALRGLLMIFLMVAAPWILLRLTTILDGYIADIDPPSFLGAAGAGAGAEALSHLAQRKLFGGGSPAESLDGAADSTPTVVGAAADDAQALDTAGDGAPVGDPAMTVGGGPAASGQPGGQEDASTPQRDEATGTAQDGKTVTGTGDDGGATPASGQPVGQTSVPPGGAGPGTPADEHPATGAAGATSDPDPVPAGSGQGAGATASTDGGSSAAEGTVPQPAPVPGAQPAGATGGQPPAGVGGDGGATSAVGQPDGQSPVPAGAGGSGTPSAGAHKTGVAGGEPPGAGSGSGAGISRGGAAAGGAAGELPVVPL